MINFISGIKRKFIHHACQNIWGLVSFARKPVHGLYNQSGHINGDYNQSTKLHPKNCKFFLSIFKCPIKEPRRSAATGQLASPG